MTHRVLLGKHLFDHVVAISELRRRRPSLVFGAVLWVVFGQVFLGPLDLTYALAPSGADAGRRQLRLGRRDARFKRGIERSIGSDYRAGCRCVSFALDTLFALKGRTLS